MNCFYNEDLNYPWYLDSYTMNEIRTQDAGLGAFVILLDSCIDTNHIALNGRASNECSSSDNSDLMLNYNDLLNQKMSFSIVDSQLLCHVSEYILDINSNSKDLFGIPEYLYNHILNQVNDRTQDKQLSLEEKEQILKYLDNKCQHTCEQGVYGLYEMSKILWFYQIIRPLFPKDMTLDYYDQDHHLRLHAFVHGTSMAGLITSSLCTLEINKLFNLEEAQYGRTRDIIGIAPKAKVFGIEHTVAHSFERAFTESTQDRIYKKERFKEYPTTNILINLSGGEEVDISRKQKWIKSIISRCDNDFLLIVAVGRALPAILKDVQLCNNAAKLLRVGAYFLGTDDSIQLHAGTERNIGSADILAPGANISSIAPRNTTGIDIGTSPAAAIVSGVAAVLSSCTKTSTEKIRWAILEYSTEKYNGIKVLNISNIIKNFCSLRYQKIDVIERPLEIFLEL
jgi:hypothetical protein